MFARMASLVHRITERNLEDVFGRAPYLFVVVDRVPSPPLPKGFAGYFDDRWPEQFAFGTMWRGEWPEGRLAQVLASAVGPLRSGVKDGLYLCEAGLVVAHHGGQLRPASASWAADAEELAARARVEASRSAVGLSAVELERLRQLAAYFEPIVERRLRVRVDPPPRDVHEEARSESGPADAYAVLGVPSTATDDEVRAAYKQALKLNHPDKVAHLSPALQQFAQQQTLAIRTAYDQIAARRGLR